MMENRFILTPYYLDEPLPGLEPLAESGWEVIKQDLSDAEQQLRMGQLYELLAHEVAELVTAGYRPVSIAGDCCSTIGIAAGLQRAGVDFTLIWLDAHGDFNTWETTPSGFLGGMPLAMLVGRGEQTMPEFVGLRSFAEEQIILTDARDLDPAEKTALLESMIVRLTNVDDLVQYPLPDRPLYVHLDVDIIDPGEAPAMNYRAPGGPSADKLQEAFRYLASTANIQAVSMSAWNPELDNDGRTREVCMRLLDNLLETEKPPTS
jgi:arginase